MKSVLITRDPLTTPRVPNRFEFETCKKLTDNEDVVIYLVDNDGTRYDDSIRKVVLLTEGRLERAACYQAYC